MKDIILLIHQDGGFENLLIFEILPGIRAFPNMLTFVLSILPMVFVCPVSTFSFAILNSKQLSFIGSMGFLFDGEVGGIDACFGSYSILFFTGGKTKFL